MRRLLVIAIVLFVGYYLVTQPTDAADAVRQAGSWISGAADSLSTFVSSL